jgi:hypothetical protein
MGYPSVQVSPTGACDVSTGIPDVSLLLMRGIKDFGLHDQLTGQGVQFDRREEGGPSIEFDGDLRSTLSCFGQRFTSPHRWAATGANANTSAARTRRTPRESAVRASWMNLEYWKREQTKK